MKDSQLSLLFLSLAFSIISGLIILTTDPALDCPFSSLRLALHLSFSVHLSSFFLLLISTFFPFSNPFILGVYSIYLVGALISV